jgi:hypothetical protein
MHDKLIQMEESNVTCVSDIEGFRLENSIGQTITHPTIAIGQSDPKKIHFEVTYGATSDYTVATDLYLRGKKYSCKSLTLALNDESMGGTSADE